MKVLLAETAGTRKKSTLKEISNYLIEYPELIKICKQIEMSRNDDSDDFGDY